jgi:hypothetical protein
MGKKQRSKAFRRWGRSEGRGGKKERMVEFGVAD